MRFSSSTNILAGLSLAVALLGSGPAFAADNDSSTRSTQAFSLPTNVDDPPRHNIAEPSVAIPRAVPRQSGGLDTPPAAEHSVGKPADIPDPLPRFDPNLRPASGSNAEIPAVVNASATVPKYEASRAVVSLHSNLEMRQSAPAQVVAGTPCPIEIVVVNRGSSPADNVVVTDQVDSVLEIVSATPKPEQTGNVVAWSLGRIEAGETRRIEFLVLPKSTQGTETAISRASLSYSGSVDAKLRLVMPQLSLSVEGPEKVVVGQPVELQLRIGNSGTAPASNVLLRNKISSGLSHSEGPELEYQVGDLAPGEFKNIPLVLDATAPGAQTSQIVVLADGVQPIESRHEIAIEDYQVELAAEGPSLRYLQQAGLYQFTVANKGQAQTPTGTLTVTLPEAVNFAHASADGRHTPGLGTVEWTVMPLEPGQSATFTVTGIATSVGEQDIAAKLQLLDQVTDTKTLTTNVKGIAAITVEVVDVADPVEVGAETIYEIRVSNQGSLPQTQVVVTCEIPEQLEAVAADGPVGQKILDGTLTFEPLAEIPPKNEVLYRVKCRGQIDGQARFKATVQSEEIPEPITKEENTTFYGEG